MTAPSHGKLRSLGGAMCILGTVACNGSSVVSPSTEGLSGTQVASGDLATLLTVTGHIAFVSTRDGNPEIYKMNANGTGVTRLTNNAADDEAPAWSPDGKKIAFVSNRAGTDEIYVMNSDGTGVTRLTNNPAGDLDPAWSPDGTKIAFVSSRDGQPKVYRMQANGAGVTIVTKTLSNQCPHSSCAFVRSPAWSPNGAKIAFMHRFGYYGATNAEVINVDGSGLTTLAAAPVGLVLSWSRSGKITYDRYFSLSNREIYVMNADGSGQTRVSKNAAVDESPSWSPEGTRIAFASVRDGNLEIYAMNANGTGVTRLTNNAAPDSDPAWGP